MRDRRLSAPVYAALKAMTKLFIDEAFGHQKVAAAATRVEQQALSDYGSTLPEKAERFMPVDVLLDLTKASGNTALLKHLADECGCLLVPLPEGLAGGALAERTGRSAKEFGDVMVRIGEALCDGRISQTEGRNIASEIREVMLELSALAMAVNAAVARDAE